MQRKVRKVVREAKIVLSDSERRREDESPDSVFYQDPRMVVHVDMKFAMKLQSLYSKRILPGSAILDLGASCASLLPEDKPFREVVGLGMNMEEMLANEELTDRVVQDLNEDPVLPFEDERFDAVVCASSVQYFTQPELVLAEAARVLRPGGVLILSFTDKAFASKAIEGWKSRGNLKRCELVMDCVRACSSFTTPELIWEVNPFSSLGLMLPALRESTGGDPFMAVVAYKDTPPAGWAMQ
ncbi:hypothetical protein GUITHDRAFT_157604 [Guillardia theta CCMP2712]|uniref:Methyltransferase type 11 domain-containing protein n=2 Tax=Guillardia theta TaxID=55529 RepID=L1JHJ0_GUITC|nr:hypothetical protein GUITHDRAFT_157604 [Guillardia theta CCMP2712]EKX47614.1 hypothetical protein GUITHDRAFT_157604 [Guillardia theta CCMP2712]|eukprot:XP_005834594.1 hypothetical protein GUITHDRAFT_157604 [Guillardia theta CCMP2712]